jgi:hypothetical protein
MKQKVVSLKRFKKKVLKFLAIWVEGGGDKPKLIKLEIKKRDYHNKYQWNPEDH